MIFQIDPYGGEMFFASPPLFRATFESSILISFWRVLRRRIGKEKKSTQAWFEKLNLAGNSRNRKEQQRGILLGSRD